MHSIWCYSYVFTLPRSSPLPLLRPAAHRERPILFVFIDGSYTKATRAQIHTNTQRLDIDYECLCVYAITFSCSSPLWFLRPAAHSERPARDFCVYPRAQPRGVRVHGLEVKPEGEAAHEREAGAERHQRSDKLDEGTHQLGSQFVLLRSNRHVVCECMRLAVLGVPKGALRTHSA